jgi:hypothetical protein
MKKNIYSLPILRERCLAANWRYIECLYALADPSAGMPQLQRVTQLVQQHHRTYRGFDFFSNQDQPMLLTRYAVSWPCSQDPAILWLSPQPVGPNRDHSRLQTQIKDWVILPDLAAFAHP